MEYPTLEELAVDSLGECTYNSPLEDTENRFVDEHSRVLLYSETAELERCLDKQETPPSFEMAGPRKQVFFDPSELVCGIVTCGGICPGLNDVIRSITLTLCHSYGVRKVIGFRYGYSGLTEKPEAEPMLLTPEGVKYIQEIPGTILGSSRGPQDPAEMVGVLQKNNISIIFTVGGDGTLRGAVALAKEIKRQKLPIAVIGVPKTIDNDINWITQSFGFSTAVEQAKEALVAAHTEAQSAWNGIGLVKLMGRDSGFIAVHASLATAIVNFCLIPEVPFSLDGDRGLLKVLEERLLRKDHAVIVVAEGAGQDLIKNEESCQRDASGNVKLQDIGLFLKRRIKEYFKTRGLPMTIKYIDPSYEIRSLSSNSMDSEFCLVLGQHAAHAGMAGKTDMVVGSWNRYFTHVPIEVVVKKRKQVDERLWQLVLGSTHQPAVMIS